MEQKADVIIVGAGIAGLTCALELLRKGKTVHIIDAQDEAEIGGLARWAFGGMALVGTPEQKRNGIIDTPEIALKDWQAFADFTDQDVFPKQWAEFYVNRSYQDVYCYLRDLGIKFLPAVNWVERGLFSPGNSVPRYHVIWGTSLELVKVVLKALEPFQQQQKLTIEFNRIVTELVNQGGKIAGCIAINADGDPASVSEYHATEIVVATGGFTGNIEKVKANWPAHWSKAPEQLLNGTHPSSDGAMHDEVNRHGGQLTHMDKMWNYAAGIPHPKPHFEGHGLSLIPCKSALWLDYQGKRIGPDPLVTGFDTNYLCQRMADQEKGYAWHVLNWKIASKEFAVSGSEHNVMIRDKKFLTFLKETILGNHRFVKEMQDSSDHFIVADNLDELCKEMNKLTGSEDIDPVVLQQTLDDYDEILARPESQWNDDQIRHIEHARKWKADKLRTCKPHPIQDQKHGPLIAIKVALISRKSLGGIQTNLSSQVLDLSQQPIPGLYAVGEAAGFGGGGASGARSLEGTFLSGCILTAQQAARAITTNE
ncbi:FAD-binding dehydrogenase [Thalassotalea sp. PS06]|uniref:FAD-binding dehydrogenase n=1 Tax=Thalassotalea sp. PS06 TaxID=2594005 RepID=UPI001164F15D|nr:FAD-binding dehydrogenase [Thalassotalea sp. PS06]QDP01447.1 FAD-binding dehydrogenase [Thalassotalea sp. PS06]